MNDGYKFGVRAERMTRSVHFGLGYVWYTEKAIVVGILFWEMYIGKVYDMDA